MSLSRRLGLGRIKYHLYHAPRAAARKVAAEGPLNLWLSARGRAAMERAARRLPPVATNAQPAAVPVCFLTGEHLWYQTAYCAQTLVRRSGPGLRLVIHDDGSLTPPAVAALRAALPNAEFESAADTEARLDDRLPAGRFPTLRARRTVSPLLRKLTDIHAGRAGWRLFLDSDMLFFGRPEFLLGWLANPPGPLHMIDAVTSYGYSPGLLAELAGAPVPERVNTGICGLKSDDLDWDRLEVWCRTTIEREGSHYLQEQAMTALLFAGRPAPPRPRTTSSYRRGPKRRRRRRSCTTTSPGRRRGTCGTGGGRRSETSSGHNHDTARFRHCSRIQRRPLCGRCRAVGAGTNPLSR